MQAVLMVGKNNSCNVSKPVIHALHANFAKDSQVRNMERNANFQHKNRGGGVI